MSKTDSEEQYRLLFDDSPISQFLEDFSEAKKYLDKKLIKKSPRALKKFLDSNIEEVKTIIKLVKIVDVNKQALKLYGAKKKSDLGSLDKIVGEESYDVFEDEIVALYTGKKVFKAEIINYSLTGQRMHLLVQVSVISGYEDLKRVLVSVVDISNQKRTQMALELSEQKYKLLFDSVPVGIGIATFSGKLLETNSALMKILRFNKGDIKKINVRELYVDPSDRDEILKKIKREGKVRNKKLFIKRKDGKVIPILANMDYFKLMGQDVVFSAFVDHTELDNYRRQLEKLVAERTSDLEQKNTELEEFVYTISHDLKSPLLSIAGFSYLIQTKIKDELDEELKTYFESIKRNIARTESIIEDILEYSRIGRVDEEKGHYSLNEILEEVVVSFLPRLKAGNVMLSIETDMPKVHIVKKRIMQVFENLIDNAIKFMDFEKQKKEIKIGIHEKGERFVVVYVSDTGYGIKESDIPKLFRLFTRIRNPLTEDISGSGIGLANVKKIIENCGGKVWVESKEGVGSKFFLQIPLK
ncbi:MAG: sensor histidine kinase [Candidatus Hodarchaeales archaeon]